MDRYRLTIDEKNFFSLFDEANLNFTACHLQEIIITPAANFWQIKLLTDKNFDKQTFRRAEEFLRNRYGVEVQIDNEISASDEVIIPEKKSVRHSSNGKSNGTSKKFSETITNISDINEQSGQVTIIGEVGADDINGVKLREFKNGTTCVSFSVTDKTDGIACKKFFKKDKQADAQPFADSIKAGSLLKIAAAAKYDEYAKETVLLINALETVETVARMDNAEVKRVELHVHTTMSAMDAVIPVEKLIKTAAAWNWSAVAITDHGVIQAFPNAAITAEKLAKQGKPIKIIYGMEG
ncbi:MAG: PHP domain-containing protein, partial [Selenomonadaceae bacterium]|nr:PHP domain-containing protein [Selenomonadaceae bacterium]